MARENSTDSEKIQLKNYSKGKTTKRKHTDTEKRGSDCEIRFENCEIDKTRFQHHNNDLRLIDSVYSLSDSHSLSI